jgi:flavin-dependent dehydrogenase
VSEGRLDFDVAIVGAGPAGATAALNLAPSRRVLLVDRWPAPRFRIGESLPGAARRLLVDMGLWRGFLEDGHAPQHCHRGAWGGPEPVLRDALADPDGHGWRLDRARFERRLRATAAARGATVLAPARLQRLARDEHGWRICLMSAGQAVEVRARLLIDAGGRGSKLAATHGARRTISDRLICGWTRAVRGGLPGGVTQIEAEADGWWYAAPLPDGGGLLALHTDADLPAARSGRSPAALLDRARALPMLGTLLGCGDWHRAVGGYCAAHSAWLDRPTGDGWIAVGDAALSFDPLASQGLFNALYTGLAAAEACDRALEGDAAGLREIDDEHAAVARTYRAHLAAWYGAETRWPSSPFWWRRRAHLERERLPDAVAG